MINAVVGAKGDMAKNLLISKLLNKMGIVNLVDKDDDADAWKKVWESEVIWLSIPRDKVKEAIEGVHLRPDQLVIDICSIKRRISEQMKTIGGSHLSLHPLHGPHIDLNGQRWVVIDVKATEGNENAKKILLFLQQQGIKLIQCETEDEHDFMMGIVISMPEMLTIVIDSLISLYAEKCGREKPCAKELMKWATPVFDLFFSSHVRKVSSSAPWLRKDLLLKSFGDLVGISREAFERMSKMDIPEIEEILTRQRHSISEIPPERMEQLNDRINKWYAASTLEIFQPAT